MGSQEFIPSGSLALDRVLGGGWACGKLINIVGDSATGKTLLAIEACANFARMHPDGEIHYIESEAAFDPAYAAAVGFPDEPYYATFPNEGEDPQVPTIERFFEYLEELCARPGAPKLVVLDSLDGLSDQAELQRRATDLATFGMAKAKAISTNLRKFVMPMQQAGVTLIVVSQVRDNIGAMFGERHTRAGGKALRFYASQELWLAHIKQLKRTKRKAERVFGVLVRARTKKNRMAGAHKVADLELHFSYGIEDVMTSYRWLRDNGGNPLKAHGKEADLRARVMDELNARDYAKLQKALHAEVGTLWDTIEDSFRPRRSKYATPK